MVSTDMKLDPSAGSVLNMMDRIIDILFVSVTPTLRVLYVVVVLVENMGQRSMVITCQPMR